MIVLTASAVSLQGFWEISCYCCLLLYGVTTATIKTQL